MTVGNTIPWGSLLYSLGSMMTILGDLLALCTIARTIVDLHLKHEDA